MGAVKGIDIIWLYRVLEDATSEAAFKIGYQMESELSESRDADLTITKDGGVRIPGALESEGSMTSVLASHDTYIKKLRQALRDGKLCEFWEINKADSDGVAEVNTFTITVGASTAGNITVTLNGVPKTVSLSAGDTTASAVAAKIRATSFVGWLVSGSGANVVFTSVDEGVKTTGTFTGGTTGATATVTKTVTGSASTGKYAATYYQGYITEYSASQGAEDLVEVSLSYAMEGEGQDGYATLTDEQAQAVQYAFVDTTQA